MVQNNNTLHATKHRDLPFCAASTNSKVSYLIAEDANIAQLMELRMFIMRWRFRPHQHHDLYNH